MDDIIPSLEQQEIITQIEHNNVIVDAVAGSGKTTTCCLISAAYPVVIHFHIII